ncbi:MAG: PQQ-dependent sugar dehydrogenase [Bacteroidota bacterium]
MIVRRTLIRLAIPIFVMKKKILLASLGLLGFMSVMGFPDPGNESFAKEVEKAAELTAGLDAPIAIGKFLNNDLPSTTPGSTVSEWTVENAFPNITFVDPVDMRKYPGTNRYVIAGKKGRIWTFENDPNVSTRTLFLDIEDQVRHEGDCGILGVIFHHEFGQANSPNRNYVYVYYRYTQFEQKRNDQLAYVRLSRFEVDPNTQTANKGSEYVMIQHYDRHDWHNGGSMFWHPDTKFLYLIIGDEGGARDEFDSSQKINHGLFGGILRIDVDRRGGNISHPIRRQPLPPVDPPSGWPGTFTQGYYIPNDNPWVNSNGDNIEEFWAIGLRSPHRMWYDEPTGDIWVGDIGQGAREEISILHKGDNAQWPYKEGFRNGFKAKPSNLIGNDTPPLLDYDRTVGSSVIGGLVYRGNKWASSLGGKYIFSDNVVQNIWVVDYYNTGNTSSELITTIPFLTDEWKDGVSHIWTDETGEVYILQLGGHGRDGGRIYKLAPKAQGGITAPKLLSQTGAFKNLNSLTPADGVIPYGVNISFWSDGALKRRWVALPNDGNHNSSEEKIQFSEDGTWVFPKGSVFIKHMDLPIDDTDPSKIKKIETRIMVRGDDGAYYSLTYRWREDESDADLVESTTGADRTININTGNGTRQYIWHYPSATECRTCHNSGADQVLGVNSRQLNGTIFYPQSGREGNQLTTMNHLNWFDQELSEQLILNVNTLPALSDNSASIESRARAYLDVNCAYCHLPEGVKVNFDARYTTPLEEQNLVLGVPNDDLGTPNARYIAPGNPAASVILTRIHSLEEGIMMPPLAKREIDNEGIEIIRQWINSMDEVCLNPPNLTVNPSDPSSCDGLGSVSVIENPIGGTFELRNTANEVVEDLDNLPIGTYSYTYTRGVCEESGTIEISSPNSPDVRLEAFDGVEIIDEPFLLTGGTPAGGTYTGPGVTNNVFDPQEAGPGKHDIVYTYVNGDGCDGTATAIIAVIGENISQTISFTDIPDKITIDVPFELQAFSNSELPVSFELVDGPAVLDSSLCTLTKSSGTVTIRAIQGGNGIFAPATPIEQSFEVFKTSQAFNIGLSDTVETLDSPFIPAIVSTSGLDFTLTLQSGPASMNETGEIVLDQVPGEIILHVEQLGNETYAPFDSSISIRVLKAAQLLETFEIPDKTVTSSAFEIIASSSRDLPIIYRLLEGPAVITENVCILLGETGSVKIEVSQPGTEAIARATPDTLEFEVKLMGQEITNVNLPNTLSALTASIPIEALSSAGLPIVAQIAEGPAIVRNDSIIFDRKSGEVIVELTQPGNNTYIAAEPILHTISLTKIEQRIDFPPLPSVIPLDMESFPLQATSESGLDVQFEVLSGPATIVNRNFLNFTGVTGRIDVRAYQPGDTLYHPSQDIVRSFAASDQISIEDSVLVSNQENLEPEDVGIQVYPNPASHMLNVDWGNASRVVESLSIFSLQGQLVRRIESPNKVSRYVQIPVQNLAKGSYLLTLTDSQGQQYRLMWSKQ